MKRILVFGNSGAGKSTLATSLVAGREMGHLDLDTLAWLPTVPPRRKPLADSRIAVDAFMNRHASWVIEGCYADLLALAAPRATDMIFLDLPVADCIANARQRPWEPHKYVSKHAQDANLAMLLDWIGDYPHRDDACGRKAHLNLLNGFAGAKATYHSRPRALD